MKLPSIIGSTALVLAGALAAGPAFGQPGTQASAAIETGQERLVQREAQRRIAVVEQQRRKEDFALRCVKRDRSGADFEACRDAYRKLYPPTTSSAF